MDFSGLDNASLGALMSGFDEITLEGAADGTGLPDPVDDADLAGTDDGTELADDVAGPDLGDTGPVDDATITASDGTTYDGYADFLRGSGPGRS